LTLKGAPLKVRILSFLTTFIQLTARLKIFLRGWLIFLGLKEGLVECATVCVKSEFILLYTVLTLSYSTPWEIAPKGSRVWQKMSFFSYYFYSWKCLKMHKSKKTQWTYWVRSLFKVTFFAHTGNFLWVSRVNKKYETIEVTK
jgi:hypothetical protein